MLRFLPLSLSLPQPARTASRQARINANGHLLMIVPLRLPVRADQHPPPPVLKKTLKCERSRPRPCVAGSCALLVGEEKLRAYLSLVVFSPVVFFDSPLQPMLPTVKVKAQQARSRVMRNFFTDNPSFHRSLNLCPRIPTTSEEE